jgi:hypothetical protein
MTHTNAIGKIIWYLHISLGIVTREIVNHGYQEAVIFLSDNGHLANS